METQWTQSSFNPGLFIPLFEHTSQLPLYQTMHAISLFVLFITLFEQPSPTKPPPRTESKLQWTCDSGTHLDELRPLRAKRWHEGGHTRVFLLCLTSWRQQGETTACVATLALHRHWSSCGRCHRWLRQPALFDRCLRLQCTCCRTFHTCGPQTSRPRSHTS